MIPNATRRRASDRATDAATTYSASTSSSAQPASQTAPSAVWTSSAISTSRSRDGSNRFVIGCPSRALARACRRRSGSPGAYGRTPANRDGSSARPPRARSRSPQRSGGSSSVVGIVRGQTRNVSVPGRRSTAARRANGSPTDSSTGPSVNTPRRSATRGTGARPARTAAASTRSAGRRPGLVAVHPARARGPPRRALASSSARSQASGRRRRFQTSISAGCSRPNGVRRPRGGAHSGRRRSPRRAQTAWTTSSSSVTTPSRITIGTSSALPTTIRTQRRAGRAPPRSALDDRRHGDGREDRRDHGVGGRAVQAAVEVDDQAVGEDGAGATAFTSSGVTNDAARQHRRRLGDAVQRRRSPAGSRPSSRSGCSRVARTTATT